MELAPASPTSVRQTPVGPRPARGRPIFDGLALTVPDCQRELCDTALILAGSHTRRAEPAKIWAMPPRVATTTTATKNVQSMVVRLPVELHQEAKQRASDEDMSLAQIIRRALKQYLARPAG